METQIVDEQNFYDIANAIRRQNGESTLYRPQDMADAILDLDVIPSNDELITIEQIINHSITQLDDSIDNKITNIGTYAFYEQYSLTTVNLPVCTTIYSYAFMGCTSLIAVNLPSCTSIGEGAFSGCTSLIGVILSGPTVCTLETNFVFDNTPIASGTGYIYVPANLVDTYKAATNWSAYASQIVAISE